jgi:hypothetical protein
MQLVLTIDSKAINSISKVERRTINHIDPLYSLSWPNDIGTPFNTARLYPSILAN